VTSLREVHDALLFDLDGTLFVGTHPLPGAPEALASASEAGARIGYLTNNGSRNAAQVADHLRELGFQADEREVVTSGQAAARLLAERLEPGSAVLVVGTSALAGEVTKAGLTVTEHADQARAVVQGHSPDTAWRTLAEACLAIRAGAQWVACNVDLTLPDERGELPGNGAMVAAVAAATGARPVVAGKPEAALYREAVRRTGATRPLMVGDRVDTDIAGARAVDMPSLLVLTGVSDAAALLAAPDPARPTYIGADLGALTAEPGALSPEIRPPWWARREGEHLLLGLDDTIGADRPDPVAALRALCQVHWAAGGGVPRPRAEGAAAEAALHTLGLAGRDAGHRSDQPVG
jgi:HAD superfamily hydrolase (TIGR01450 family)